MTLIKSVPVIKNNNSRNPATHPVVGRGVSANGSAQIKAPAVVNATQQRAPVSNPHARLV